MAKISRREFARGAALAAAVAALSPDALAQTTPAKPAEKKQQPAAPNPTAPGPSASPSLRSGSASGGAAGAPGEQELSKAAKAEAEESYRALMGKYGGRFSDEQKKDIARLLEQQQKAIEAVRAFSLENGDEPATVLRLDVSGEDGHGAR